MAGNVVHFAVYAADPEALIRFYSDVFGWRFEAWGPAGFWNIFTPGDKGMTMGALTQREHDPEPGTPNAFRCTISVADLDATTTAIETHGGTVESSTIDIPGVGRVTEFKDPAGNVFCAMHYAPGTPLAD